MKTPINIFKCLQTITKKLIFLVIIALPVLALAQTDQDNLFNYSPDEINEYFTEDFGLGLRYQNFIPKGNTNTLVFSNDESDYKSYFQVNVMYNKDYSAIICIAYMTGDKFWYTDTKRDLEKSKEEYKYEVSEGSETFTFSDLTFELVKKFNVQTGRTGYMIMILSNTEIKNANTNE